MSSARSKFGGLFAILFAFVIAACTACGASPPVQESCGVRKTEFRPAHVAVSKYATIILKAKEDDRLVCAGTRVSSTRLVTAYHCVVASVLPYEVLRIVRLIDPLLTRVEIADLSQQYLPYTTYDSYVHGKTPRKFARVVKIDPKNDLALLEASNSEDGQPSVSVRTEPLVAGDEVYAIGHPAGNEFAYTHGAVSASCREMRDVCFTEVDVTITGGSSGGGLYNAAGKLVGVTSAGYSEFALGYFSTPDALRSLLDETAK